jgi:chromate transporter
LIITFFLSFLKLGFTAFGGPAMVAYIKEFTVEKNNGLMRKYFRKELLSLRQFPVQLQYRLQPLGG